jgi:hypothetical protein
LLASLPLAHCCRCVPLWNRTTHSLLPCSSSSAPCSLQGRLPVLPQALFSIPLSPSPEGFYRFYSFGFPFVHSLSLGFVSLAPVSLERFVVASPGFWSLVCLA